MTKKTIIKKIQAIIKEHGSFTTADVQADSSPSVGALKGINQLAESFYFDNAEIVTYDRNDEEIDSERMDYSEMKKETLSEILHLAEQHEAESLQDEDRQGKNQSKYS